MTARPTRISTDVDFDKDGKQVSNLFMPWSMNDSAYKVVHIPIACIKNGPGPTMLFTAALDREILDPIGHGGSVARG